MGPRSWLTAVWLGPSIGLPSVPVVREQWPGDVTGEGCGRTREPLRPTLHRASDLSGRAASDGPTSGSLAGGWGKAPARLTKGRTLHQHCGPFTSLAHRSGQADDRGLHSECDLGTPVAVSPACTGTPGVGLGLRSVDGGRTPRSLGALRPSTAGVRRPHQQEGRPGPAGRGRSGCSVVQVRLASRREEGRRDQRQDDPLSL
jgi:hypothetical protein